MSKNKKAAFLFYEDWYKAMAEMTDSQVRMLLTAICAYAFEGENTELAAGLNFVFTMIKSQLDRNAEDYREICEKRSAAGKKHKGNQYTKKKEVEQMEQMFQNETNGTNGTDNDNDNDNELSITSTKVSVTDNIDKTISNEIVCAEQPSAPAEKPFKEVLKDIVDFFNKSMSGKAIRPVQRITTASTRGKLIHARLMEYGIEDIYKAITNASESAFMNGNNSKCWVADLEWMMKPNNFPKVLEGNYNEREKPVKVSTGQSAVSVAAEKNRQDDLQKAAEQRNEYIRMIQYAKANPDSSAAKVISRLRSNGELTKFGLADYYG